MRLVHADEALVVVDKPAGLLAVPGRGADKQDCAWRRVQADFADALVTHRLDMATSGLLVFARGAAAQRQLSIDFAQRRVRKRYVAVVTGAMPRDVGSDAPWSHIELSLSADWSRRPLQRVDAAAGKPALTRWRCLGAGPWPHTLRVEVEPLTGRTHQIRVHLAAIGHPIVGDALYAPPEVARMSSRLMLHAAGLELMHPSDRTLLRLVCSAAF
jgi:tRNA pseudouridine32 synthase/23S rRNA pseudouridine746 synthase